MSFLQRRVSCCGNKLHFDWQFLLVEITVRFLLATSWFLLFLFKPPPIQVVYDWSPYRYPYTALAHEVVPMWLAIVLASIAPLVAIVFFAIPFGKVKGWTATMLLDEIVFLALSLSLSVLLSGFFTELLKRFVGRVRPNFLGRCLNTTSDPWNSDNWPAEWKRTGIPAVPDCKGILEKKELYDEREIENGRLSFPSGHAMLIFATWGYCACWCWGNSTVSPSLGALRFIVSFAFLIVPIIVSASRIIDYQHHYEDVLAGSLIGLFFAVMSYRLYFNYELRPMTHPFYGFWKDRYADDTDTSATKRITIPCESITRTSDNPQKNPDACALVVQ